LEKNEQESKRDANRKRAAPNANIYHCLLSSRNRFFWRNQQEERGREMGRKEEKQKKKTGAPSDFRARWKGTIRKLAAVRIAVRMATHKHKRRTTLLSLFCLTIHIDRNAKKEKIPDHKCFHAYTPYRTGMAWSR
jgi:hypothetical protein